MEHSSIINRSRRNDITNYLRKTLSSLDLVQENTFGLTMMKGAIVLLVVVCVVVINFAAGDENIRRDDAYRSYDGANANNDDSSSSEESGETTTVTPPPKSLYWKSKPVKSGRQYLYGSGVPPQQQGSRPSLNNYAYFSIWRDFKRTHNKSYTTTEEEAARFHIFVDNHKKIQDHNQEYEAGRKSYQLDMNKYGDMTNDEFSSRVNGFKRTLMDRDDAAPLGSTFMRPHNVVIPEQMDWRQKGYVTHVKDQGQCGSCWAFSAVGALEGQHYRKSGTMVELSEQNLVDCSKKFGNEGCNGGLMDNAFNYIKKNDGIDTELSYPYEAKDGRCRFKKEDIGADDTGYVDVKQGDEDDLDAAIATVGPVSVAIDASHESFQFYKKGVYFEPDCSPTSLDHGVLAVGYGVTTKGEKYYIVKNSWGAEWGEQGYIRMTRHKDNHCGIASSASYPLV